MKVSCLIAAYKADATIAKALESLRPQLHEDWEVVVVEDGSRGQTEQLVADFAASVRQPVRYENLGVNQGVAAARNRLLDLAAGDAVAFLDADDWWTPAHLQRAAAAHAGGAGLVVARIQTVDLATGRLLETVVPPADLFADPLRHLFSRSSIMTSSCVSLTRALADRAGRVDPALRIGEDRDYWMRCAATGARFADSGEITCFYAKHAGSTMAKTLLWAQQEVAFYEKHQSLAAVPASARKSHLFQALLNHGRVSRGTDPRTSTAALARAWRLRPASATAALQWAVSRWRLLRTQPPAPSVP